MLSPCTATMPAARPSSLRGHEAGKASIAASSTSVASTPLQPASIDTAKPLPVERSTLPAASTPGSKSVTRPADTCASAFVHGTTNHCWTGGVSSSPNSTPSSTRNRMKKRIIGRSCPRERRILREVGANARRDGLGESLLLALAAKLELLLGIGDERRLHQDRRDVGRFQHGESRLLHRALVERIVRCEAVQHLLAHLEAVVDLRGLRQVEQCTREHR